MAFLSLGNFKNNQLQILKMKRVYLILLICFSFYNIIAQRITKEQYIDLYKDLAIREMKRMGVPAAITLAQGLLETEGGNSDLLKKSNNHFGIKCKDTWSANGVSHDDDAKGECFRVYKSAEESYRDHSNFLRSRAWYAPLFKLDPADYKAWAYGLKKAGYATNPKYPEILIKYIEDNNLQQYSLMALKDVAHFDASKYKDDPEEKDIEEVVKNTGGEKPSNTNVAFNNPKTVYINKTKAVFVKAGVSLLAIATINHINLDKLLEYNDLEKDGLIDKDQYIFIERKAREGQITSYQTSGSETLWQVSQKNGIRLQKLCEYNNLKVNDQVKPGTILYLNPTKHTTLNINSSETKTNKVEPKEELNIISKKFGMSEHKLRVWNNLQDDNLRVGQELIVSK